MFFFVERWTRDAYWLSSCALDGRIPFAPQFVYAYVLWYPLMLGMSLWLLLTDRRAFLRYGWSVILGLTACIAIFIAFPSAQALRPASVPGGDLASALLRAIYAADTSTNVLPSMHVVGALAAAAAAFDPGARLPRARWGVAALAALICASTVLVKQHSALDVAAGAALFVPVWLLSGRLSRRRRRGARQD